MFCSGFLGLAIKQRRDSVAVRAFQLYRRDSMKISGAQKKSKSQKSQKSFLLGAVAPRLPLRKSPKVRALAAKRPGKTSNNLIKTENNQNPKLQFRGTLADLAQWENVVRQCGDCRLSQTRTQVVVADGDPRSPIVFLGEAPGQKEDETGKPFVGRSGTLLTKMIEAMGLSRDKVYILNTVKCRPPDNRYPKTEEIEACRPHFLQQMECLRPKVIVTLGTCATQSLLQVRTPISELRGKFQSWSGISVMPTYHPSYLLRSPSSKRICWEDLKLVLEHLHLPVPEMQPSVTQKNTEKNTQKKQANSRKTTSRREPQGEQNV